MYNENSRDGIISNLEKRLEKKVEDCSSDWVVENGNTITSDKLAQFFWKTFLVLQRERTKVIYDSDTVSKQSA